MLELEQLRRFVAVVETRSFTIAARELRVSQPALSQAIARLERELGCVLIERNRRNPRAGVLVTPVGAALLPEAIALLAAADRTEARVRRAAGSRGRPTVTVGFSPGVPPEYLDAALTSGGDEADVVAVQLEWGREHEAIVDGRADLALLQVPLGADLPHCVLHELARVDRIALLPADHPLGRLERVRLADLAGEPILDPGFDDGPPGFRELWLGLPRPSAAPLGPVIGPPKGTVDEMYAFVAAHRGMAITTEVVPGTYQRADVVARRIEDLEPVVIGLAALAGDHRPAVREAACAVLTVPRRPHGGVSGALAADAHPRDL